jgi:LysM repeat protein
MRSLGVIFLVGSLSLGACTRFFDSPGPATSSAPVASATPILAATPTLPPVVLAPEGRRATVSEIVNIAESQNFAEGNFEPVQDGTLIGPGGVVRTGDNSRARIDLGNSATIRLDANTVFGVASMTDSKGIPLNVISLNQGRLWVTVNQGSVQVVTSLGLASVRGSFAVFTLNSGNPNDVTDDTLTLDCIEGLCAVQTKNGDSQAGNLERLVLIQNVLDVKHTPLSETDIQDFLTNNPDSGQGVALALTAAIQPAGGSTVAPTESTTIQPTDSGGPTAVPVLGKHVVKFGESLFCIGRAYGVLPGAIAQANGLDLNGRINPNQELIIPAVRWLNIPGGPVCVQQFNSPFPAGPLAPPTQPPPVFFPTAVFNQPTDVPVPTEPPTEPPPPTLTPYPVCDPPQVYDPAMDRCRILQP